MLDVLDAVSASIESRGAFELADVDKVLDFLRWFADGHHQAKEETILFPALKCAAASQGRPVDHMVLEHNQERNLIEELEKDLRLSNLREFVTCANLLSSTLRNHIYKEDHILFDIVDRSLSEEQDDRVTNELRGFETELDKQRLEQKLAELRSLEWKYLGK